jgi:hypothetical protein
MLAALLIFAYAVAVAWGAPGTRSHNGCNGCSTRHGGHRKPQR